MTQRIGVIGCGNISTVYLTHARLFRDLEMVACADLNAAAAERQAQAFGLQARSIEALLASDDIDIVLNLTVPEAHAAVSRAALEAGKHVYGEKPLATRSEDGRQLLKLAGERGLRIGCAPDTVLGPGIQTARQMIDSGAIGKPILGSAAVMGHGMEAWHPDPRFFFKAGGGPVFDMGPYYLSTLVHLLGPVASVMALGQRGFEERVASAPESPIRGQRFPVEVPTSVHALLAFESGAQVAFAASWDVWSHGQVPIEVHGTLASLRVPDPNMFGGEVAVAHARDQWQTTSLDTASFGVPNWPVAEPARANYRGLGLAEMAQAIEAKRAHRASAELALHALEVMEAIQQSLEQHANIRIESRCERPALFDETAAASLLAKSAATA